LLTTLTNYFCGYFAEPNVQFGIEIDVAAFSEQIPANSERNTLELEEWAPSRPSARWRHRISKS
jgi:hypothetical protein